MNSAIERLLTLRVRDVMRQKVITVRGADSMTSAADVFERNEISGAPVVDDQGRCMGMLSSADFVYRELVAAPAETSQEMDTIRTSIRVPRAERVAAGEASQRVEHFMSPLVQTISQEAPIMAAARLMCDEHIHRLVVVNHDQRPLGILSALDLVACMIVAVEE